MSLVSDDAAKYIHACCFRALILKGLCEVAFMYQSLRCASTRPGRQLAARSLLLFTAGLSVTSTAGLQLKAHLNKTDETAREAVP